VPDAAPSHDSPRAVVVRVAWTVLVIIAVETIVCGVAMLPACGLWLLASAVPNTMVPRILVYSVIAIPSYVVFALALMVVSPAATRLTGARSTPNVELRIRDMGWPVLTWARYMIAIHVVRVLAGSLFRGSPIWTAYLRLNGEPASTTCSSSAMTW